MNNPYYDSSIAPAPRQLATPGLSGIDASSIYGRNSPGYGMERSNPATGADYAGAAVGALGLGLQTYGMTQQRLGLRNSQIAPSQYDLNSAPSYTAGAAQSQAINSKPHGINGGEVLGGAAQGAAIGSMVPVIGTAVGAVAGAGIAAVGGLIRGGKQRREREAALQRVLGSQQQYNAQNVAFRNQQNQQQEYLRRINPYNREYAVNQTRF